MASPPKCAKYKAAVFKEPGAQLSVDEREFPALGPHQVLLKVEACCVSRNDLMVKAGKFPGIKYPRVPGHEAIFFEYSLTDEVIGRVAKIGPQVHPRILLGSRKGVGWHGGHCSTCHNCRRGDFLHCSSAIVTGLGCDGGYSEALISIPEEVDAAVAVPMLCGGTTVFNGLRNKGACPGDLIAVVGIGGLGIMGIAFAAKMGFRVVAISSSATKRTAALKHGANVFVDTSVDNPTEILKSLGGAKIALCTAPAASTINNLLEGMAVGGTVVIIARMAESLTLNAGPLIEKHLKIVGCHSGSPGDAEDALRFAVHAGITIPIERFTLDEAQLAFDCMEASTARFRSVLMLDEAEFEKLPTPAPGAWTGSMRWSIEPDA